MGEYRAKRRQGSMATGAVTFQALASVDSLASLSHSPLAPLLSSQMYIRSSALLCLLYSLCLVPALPERPSCSLPFHVSPRLQQATFTQCNPCSAVCISLDKSSVRVVVMSLLVSDLVKLVKACVSFMQQLSLSLCFTLA